MRGVLFLRIIALLPSLTLVTSMSSCSGDNIAPIGWSSINGSHAANEMAIVNVANIQNLFMINTVLVK